MSDTVKQEESLPWLKDDKQDFKDLADSSVEVIGDTADAVSDAAEIAIDAVSDAVDNVLVEQVEHTPQKAGMPQFDTNWYPSQLFWLVVCFTLLYFFMSRGIIPRIREVLESRQHRIDADLDFARSMQGEAETVKLEYEASIATAQFQVRELIQEAQATNEVQAASAFQEIDEKIAASMDKAEKEITAQLDGIEKDSLPVVKELSSMLVEKILLKKPAAKQVDAAVKEEMASFSLKKAS